MDRVVTLIRVVKFRLSYISLTRNTSLISTKQNNINRFNYYDLARKGVWRQLGNDIDRRGRRDQETDALNPVGGGIIPSLNILYRILKYLDCVDTYRF